MDVVVRRVGWAVVVALFCSTALARVAERGGASLAEVAVSPDRQWTGVAVSRGGRMFVSYPRWLTEYRSAVEELRPDGTCRPYPNRQWNEWAPGDADPRRSFVCVQSVYVDDRDRLWILDPASPNMEGVVRGGAKLVEVDLRFDSIRRVIHFDETVAPRRSYLNDVRVDTQRGYAYITDSGRGALIVVDLLDSSARRVLDGHPATQAQPGFVPAVQGQRLIRRDTGRPARIHSDGIALDHRGDYLYWQALTGRTLYRIPTDVLRDSRSSEHEIQEAIEPLGETVATDGIEIDREGNVYFTALEHDAIMFRTPQGRMQTLVADPMISWPDSIALTQDHELYFTTSQIHRTPWFTEGLPDEPYRVFRTTIEPGFSRTAEPVRFED